MITERFSIMLKVEIFHTWFEKDICRCLQIVPSPVTSKLLKRFGFLIRNNINGFELYTNTATEQLASLLTYMKNQTGITALIFDIINTHPQFYLFTEFPVNWVGQMEYTSEDLNNKIYGSTIQLSQKLVANNSNANAGKLQVSIDTLLSNNNAQGCMHYTIRFDARATQWQYFIINKNALALNNLNIIGKTGIAFSGPLSVTTQDGQQALLFSSASQLLPLSEKPRHKFDLVNSTVSEKNRHDGRGNTGKTLYRGLPNPGPGQVGPAEIEGIPQLSSPMYIYL